MNINNMKLGVLVLPHLGSSSRQIEWIHALMRKLLCKEWVYYGSRS